MVLVGATDVSTACIRPVILYARVYSLRKHGATSVCTYFIVPARKSRDVKQSFLKRTRTLSQRTVSYSPGFDLWSGSWPTYEPRTTIYGGRAKVPNVGRRSVFHHAWRLEEQRVRAGCMFRPIVCRVVLPLFYAVCPFSLLKSCMSVPVCLPG